jgi:hypothetical protein
LTDNYQALHFFDQPIEPIFDTPPAREKSPDCPNGFVWEEKTYRVIEMLSAWSDFTRRGKMARNMRPAHAAVASGRGSLNVGRFYFRVRVRLSSSSTAGQTKSSSITSPLGTAGHSEEQIFDIYYDRAMKNVDDRKGQWFIYREMREE